MHAHATQEAHRPRLLFVDDEQRVLNSMRIMFRRQFELFLASHGAEALDIVRDKDIDVIVADHRMPKMTGVEVLSKVRAMSPRTVRILLTGYADLDAVEGSINESEVFRFLTKPCAPQQLRETIELAAKLAREAPAPVPTEPLTGGDTAGDTIEIILESDTVTEVGGSPPPAPAPAPQRTSSTAVLEQPKFPPQRAAPAPAVAERPKLATGLGIVVFSMDNEVIDCVNKAVRGRLPVYNAGNIVQVVKCLTEQKPGVLVTDVSEDKATIQSMTARLKEHLPQLVTIAVSQHRDVLDMVWLINHGQIFRFLRKPLSAGRTAISLQAALQHHRQLLKNPELAKRHEVDTSAAGDPGVVDGVLSKLKGLKRLWNN
jgi:DNA-binding NtrC family response regulator